ncbi:hypothetical protein [Marinifilum caeruleilacunae]|uniref:Uncharacterized protein n=1 Tax=Marinifilum caeruleilacunae TaxID=2499076 RepID=A0ABX1X145_9BACT|nr:hypothetical protein [Marinifilum caeruleilacunae]NOU62034.1 hypothetical protein [Marinifilum caeruleilacunae]
MRFFQSTPIRKNMLHHYQKTTSPIIFLFAIIIALTSIACKKQNTINETIHRMIDSQIKNVDSLSIYYPKHYVYKPLDFDVKIYSIINGACNDCIMEFDEWSKFISQNEFSDEVNYYFHIHAAEYKELENLFDTKGYTFFFVKDPKMKFIKINNLPKDKMFHTFLVSDNKIILVGSPLKNGPIKDLYIKTINRILNASM